jgi:hypothetical protein
MKFLVSRSSEGTVSKDPPCEGAVRGHESAAWPGEYEWFVELNSLEELVQFLERTGGGLGLWAPEEGTQFPELEIFEEVEGDFEEA